MKLEVLALLALVTPLYAFARGLASTDGQVRQQIAQQSVADCLATGHPCACSYNVERQRYASGDMSAGVMANWGRRIAQ